MYCHVEAEWPFKILSKETSLHYVSAPKGSFFPEGILQPNMMQARLYAQVFFRLFFEGFLSMQHVGSQFLNQGSDPRSLHWKCRVPTAGPPGESCPTSSLISLFLWVLAIQECLQAFIYMYCYLGLVLLPTTPPPPHHLCRPLYLLFA